jgi:hypothetical protein
MKYIQRYMHFLSQHKKKKTHSKGHAFQRVNHKKQKNKKKGNTFKISTHILAFIGCCGASWVSSGPKIGVVGSKTGK